MRYFSVLLIVGLGIWGNGAALAGERAGRVGVVLSWLELNNFQAALPSLDLAQRAMLLSLRSALGSDGGFSLRLGVGWGFGFGVESIILAHFESAIAWGFLFERLRLYTEGGMGMLRLRQGATEVWRLTGWLAGGGQMRFIWGTLIFFEIAPMTLLDFNTTNLPWVWLYRTGVLWQF